MSEQIKIVIGQIQWATKNLAYNLDFIPDDKLNWKPSPTANSALEIVSHLVGAFEGIGGMIQRGVSDEASEHNAAPTEKPPLTSREEAKAALAAAADYYVGVVKSLRPEQLGQVLDLPFGKMPVGFVMGMGAMDSVHHHGQIAYIRALLGDEESHFDMSLLPGS